MQPDRAVDTPPQARLAELSKEWLVEATRMRQGFGFSSWMGRPILQLPQDMMAMQELIWRLQPDLIIETGIAMGGSLVYYASLLTLIGGEGRVLGIDIDIRAHNREAIEAHPMAGRIDLLEGSAIDPALVARVAEAARGKRCVLVVLDSNHTHSHVLAELELYGPLVTKGSYMVVFDTAVDDMPAGMYPDRPWGPGDNPKTAVHEYLRHTRRFAIDPEFQARYHITVAPDGFLMCLED